MNLFSPVIPFDILHSFILGEVILAHLHSVLVTGEDVSWSAFSTLPLVCHEFNKSCQIYYRMIFGLKTEDYKAIYTGAKHSWSRVRGLVCDSENDLVIQYKKLMENKSVIQVYICLAYSRRFMNLDILSPLFYRRRSNRLPNTLKPVELILGSKSKTFKHDDDNESEGENPNDRDFTQMRDDKMHRLFMPLSCAMKLCDVISPPVMTKKVAQFAADIVPYCITIPILLKYAQDLESYLRRDYPISSDVQADWVLKSLDLISGIDSFFNEFIKNSDVVSSFLEFNHVPKSVYEITGFPRLLTRVSETDWGCGSESIRDRAHKLLTKIEVEVPP